VNFHEDLDLLHSIDVQTLGSEDEPTGSTGTSVDSILEMFRIRKVGMIANLSRSRRPPSMQLVKFQRGIHDGRQPGDGFGRSAIFYLTGIHGDGHGRQDPKDDQGDDDLYDAEGSLIVYVVSTDRRHSGLSESDHFLSTLFINPFYQPSLARQIIAYALKTYLTRAQSAVV
jgi:hypothetical protein